MFGRSFNDIGNAILGKISSFNEEFEQTGKFLDSWNSSDSIWRRLYPSKESVQSQLIDVDSVLPKIDENEASSILTLIKSIEDGTYAEAKSFQELYDTGDKTNQWIAQYAQETQGQIRTTEGVIQANQKARQTALEHNAALKQQTLGAKAASVAMKGLSMVGNMLAFAAISKGIEVIGSAIDKHIINPAKYAKEAMQEAQQAIDDSQNTLKTLSDTINNNKDRFLELSQGVDRFSNNKLLSEEDYAEFLSISQEIADVAPDLVEGYDDQGNALIRLGENAKETEELLNRLLELQQKTANETLADNIDEIADGVRYDVESTRQEIEALERELAYVQNNTSSSDMNIIDTLEKHGGLTFEAENYNKYGKKMEQALTDAGIEFTIDSNINSKTIMLEGEILEDNLKRAQEYFDLSVEIQERAYRSEEAGLKRDLAEKEKLYNEHYSKMTPNLQAWVKENYQYQALGENQKLVDSLIPSLDWNKIVEDSGLESFSAHSYQNYIEDKIIKPLMEIPDEHQQEVNNMIQQLLSFEDGDLDILQVSDQLQATLKKLNIEIDLSPIISNEQEAKDKLQNSIETIAKGSDFYTGSGAQVNAEDYATLQEYTKDFTAEQIELWLEVTNGTGTATDAIKALEEALSDGKTNASWSFKFDTLWNSEGFSEAKKSLQDLAKESKITEDDIISLAKENDELATLLDESGMSAQFAAKCFEKMCNGTGDFSSITDSALALDKALHETENALLDAANAKAKYDDAMSEDDYNTEFKNYQEAYATAMESFKNGEYGKQFRASMEYLLGDESYTMSIEELYDAMKNLKSVFGEDANNGLEFLDRLYENKKILDDLDSTLEKTSDGGYKFDIKVEEFDEIGKSLGMTTEEVTACVEALGMFGDYTSFDIDKVKKALDDMSISSEKSNKSTLSLQGLKNTLSDLGYEGYEAYQILEKLRSEEDIKLLDFDVTSSEQVVNLINKLKELEAIHIDPSGAINATSLVQELSALGMTSDQITTFISQINELTSYHFDGSNFKDLQSIQEYVDGVLGNDDKSSIESMDSLKESEDEAKKSAENLEEAIEGVNNVSVSTVTDGVSDLSDKLDKANNMAVTLKDNLDKLNLDNSDSSTGSSEHSNVTPTPTPQATGTFAYANGSKVSLNKDQEALVNELGEESIVRDGELHVIPGGAHIEKLKKGDIIFNHKQTEELKKHGRVTTNNGRGKVIGAFKSGTVPAFNEGYVPGKNPATDKKWSTSKDDDKDKDTSTDTTKFQEAIDWCSQSIENLSRTLERLTSKLENTSSWNKQLKIQDKIIAQQKKLLKGYTKSSNVYKKEYTQSLNTINKKDRKKYKSKIESGAKFSIQDFSNEKTYNKVIAAQEAYNKWQDEVTKKKQAQYDLDQARLDKIQIKIDKQTSLIERDEAKLSAISTSNYKQRNKLIDKLIKEQKESYRLQIAMAKTDAERVKLQNELNTAIAEYKKQQFENIQAKYDNASNHNRTKQSRIQSQIDLKEAKGEQIGTAYYEAMIKYNTSNKTRLQKEEKALQKSLNNAVENGSITKYSQEWYDMTNAIYEVQNAIDEMDKSTAEYNETLKELADTRFDNLIKQFDKLQSNMEFVGELLDYEELYDDDGNMTDEGIAKLGVLLSNLESKKAESDQIASRKSSLQDLLTQAKAKGTTSLEFEDATYSIEQAEEKLAELNDTAQESILDYKSLEKTIADYLEEGMQAQIDAYNELIDKKKEALEADQDLYEFQKKMKESTQDIVLLERQLAGIENDDSDEARKKRRELEQQLKEAKESQSDDLRDRAIEMQKENLDKQAEQYEKDMKEKIEHISENLDEFIKVVNTNSGNILTVLKAIASQNGYELPEEIEKIFHEKDNAVSNPNSTDTTSNTKTVANNIVASETKKNNNAENMGVTKTANISKENNEVTKQEVNKTKALKQTVKEIMQRGTTKSIKKMSKKEKATALKNETILNKYLIEKKSKKLSASLQLELAKALGFNKLTKKTVVLDKNSKKIKNKLKKANIGYAQGGYVNTVDLMDIAKSNGDTGWITAKNGEYVLTKAQTDNFLKLSKIAPEFVNATQAMMDNMNLTTTALPYVSNATQPQNIDNSVNIQVSGNPDKDALRQMEKIAQNIVDSNQKQVQRMAYNRGMRIR